MGYSKTLSRRNKIRNNIRKSEIAEKRVLQKPRLLHFAPYFNYPSCHFNDQSELGARFSARLTSNGNVKPKAVSKLYSMRKSSQQNVGAATPTKNCKMGRKPHVNVKKKKKAAVVDFVESTSGGERASFENLFSPSGRVESAGMILAHCWGSIGLQLSRNENCQSGSFGFIWNSKTTNTLIHHRSSFVNHTRFQTKMSKMYTRFQSRNGAKTLSFEAASLYGFYKGDPPPPRRKTHQKATCEARDKVKFLLDWLATVTFRK